MTNDRPRLAPPAPADSVQPGIDELALAELRDEVGEAVFHDLLDDFARDAASVLREMAASAAVGDEEAIRRHAHRLSGLLGQFGCVNAAASCSELENALQATSRDQVQRAVDQSRSSIEAVRRSAAR